MGRVLVTGAAGFIGANAVRALLEHGYEVRGLDDGSVGSRDYLAELNGSLDMHWRSIADPDAVERAVDGADAVIHLAAHAGVPQSVAAPAQDFEVNVCGTFNIIDAARRAGVRNFIFASSAAVVAGGAPPFDESMRTSPRSPYGASKAYGESLCEAFEASFGITCVSLRFSNVYGPFGLHKKSVVNRFVQAVLDGRPLEVEGDGSQTRDFVNVLDIVRGILGALEREEGGLYHLGTAAETSILDLARCVSEAAGVPLETTPRPGRPGDPARNFPDASLARDDLGWSAEISLPDGVRQTLDWVRAFRSGEPEWLSQR